MRRRDLLLGAAAAAAFGLKAAPAQQGKQARVAWCQRRSNFRPAGRSNIRPVSLMAIDARSAPREGPFVHFGIVASAVMRADLAGLWIDDGFDRGLAGRAALAPLGLLEPVAVAVHLQDVDVVGQPIEQRASEALGGEHARPILER